MSSQETLTFQPPHPKTEKETKFLRSLSTKERELHTLATQMLGSSYFTDKTHGYTKWLASSSSPNKQPPGAK